MKTIAPRAFKQGDTAHIISPSAGLLPFVPQRVERATKALQALGYKVIIGTSAALNNGYVSADVDARVNDIHAAFGDPDCSLVLCSIGGNHSNQLLDKLDYELIRKNPKSFCGYSDITVLHLAILAKTGLQTIYGPTFLNQFGEYPQVLDFTLNHFRKTVMGQADIQTKPVSAKYTDEILDWFTNEDAKRARKQLPTPGLQVWKAGQAHGNALPFTIPSVNHVINTDYMPDATGSILFIDIPEGSSMHEGLSVGEFDSWFCDLLRSGLIANASGLVIGRAYKYTTEMVDELKQVVTERCRQIDIPIIYGFDIGHTDPMTSLRFGALVEIDTQAATKVNYEA